MIRAGELMVIIRAQDFASRTLHRVSGELSGMQKAQAMSLRAQKAAVPHLRRQAQLLPQLARAQSAYTKAAMASGSATFGWTKQGRAMGRTVQYLQQQLAQVRQHLPRDMWTKIAPSAAQEAALDRAIRVLDAKRMHRFGAALSGLGRTMQLFGAVGVASLGIMANSFAKFSASASTAATQMRDLGGSTAQIVARSKELQDAILEMSMVFPASADDMTNAAYEIFSSMNLMENGIMNVQGGLNLLAVANKAAVAGGVDLAEATNAMIIALNTFDPTLSNVKGTMDDLFNIVRFGKLRFDDLSKTLSSFAAVAKASGLSLKSVGAAFSTLTLFMEPGRAAAGLGRLIELFRVPDFAKGFEAAGVKVMKASGQMRPLLDIFQDLVKIRPDLAASQTAAVDFFIQITKASGLTKKGIQGTVQARRAFEQLVTHMATFSDTTKNVATNVDEMNKAFEARMLDPGVQWEIFKNQLRALVIVIGREAIPVFLKLGGWIAGAIQWFKGLGDGTRGTIIKFTAFLAIATLMVGVLGSVAGAVLQIRAAMILLSGATAAATGTLVAMRTALLRAGIFGIIIIGSGYAAEQVVTHWNEVRAYFNAWRQDQKAGWKHFWTETWYGARHTASNIINLFSKVMPVGGGRMGRWAREQSKANLETINNMDDNFTKRYKRILAEYDKATKGVGKTDWLKDINAISKGLTSAAFRKQWEEWANTIGDNTSKAAQMAKDHAEAVKQATENMNNTIKTATANLVNTYEELEKANRSALGGLFQGPTMQGILGNVFSNINNTLRQFGVQIPVPFNILKQDLQQSVTYFKRWRTDIAKVAKRLPKDIRDPFMAELQGMGIEGIPILEGLMSAPKGQFKSIIKMYRQGQKLTDKATQDDMNRKLEYWNQFGKDAAWQMVMGIISNPRNARIQKMYEDYVKTTYGSILKKVFQDDVAEYMANAVAMAQAAATTAKITPPPTAPGGTGGFSYKRAIAKQEAIQKQARETIRQFNKFVGPFSPEQQKAFNQAKAMLRNARRREAMLRYEQAATPTIRRQMRAQQGKGAYYNITYEGEKISVIASGATVQSVAAALAAAHFKKKHKKKPAPTANKVGP